MWNRTSARVRPNPFVRLKSSFWFPHVFSFSMHRHTFPSSPPNFTLVMTRRSSSNHSFFHRPATRRTGRNCSLGHILKPSSMASAFIWCTLPFWSLSIFLTPRIRSTFSSTRSADFPSAPTWSCGLGKSSSPELKRLPFDRCYRRDISVNRRVKFSAYSNSSTVRRNPRSNVRVSAREDWRQRA